MLCGHQGTSRLAASSAVLGLALSACGGKSETATLPPLSANGDATLLFASGTRLKAHYLDGGGGARALLAFHDSLLDIACNFVETAVGQYACLPIAQTIYFADAGCTAPTFAASSCPNVPAPVAGELVSAPSVDCTAQVAPFSLDSQQMQAAAFSLSTYGGCASSSMSSPAAQAAWTTRPEPLARFVHGTLSVVGAAGGLQATRITGDDGAYTALELLSARRPCTPITFGIVERCVPEPLAQQYGDAYADSSCTDANVAIASLTPAQQCAAASPQYLVESTSSSDACTVESAVYTLGDPLSSVFVGLDSCMETDLSRFIRSGELFYRMGAPVTASAFSALRTARIGTGMLTLWSYIDSAGTPLLARGQPSRGGDWALADGTLCQLLDDPSGQKRCVHDSATTGSSGYFSDDGCTEPIYDVDTSCSSRAIAYLVAAAYDTCSSRFTQANAAKPYSGPIYSNQSGSCQPYPFTSSGRAFAVPGDVIDPATFPAVGDTTDL